MEPAVLVGWMEALWTIGDEATCEQAAALLLRRFPLDGMLVPLAIALAPNAQDKPGWRALRDACVTHLQRRASEPLEAPKDMSRPASWACKCEYCRSLRTFLSDPVKESWSLKATLDIRGHVEEQVQSADADLDLSTIKRGSPHTLVCIKNQRSYERRVAQRRDDLAALAALGVQPS